MAVDVGGSQAPPLLRVELRPSADESGGRGGRAGRWLLERSFRGGKSLPHARWGVIGHGSGGAAAGVRGVDRNFVVGEKEHAIIFVEKVT